MKNLFGLFFFFLFQLSFSQSGTTIIEYDLISFNNSARASNNYLYLSENRNLFLNYGHAGSTLNFEKISIDYKDRKIGNILEYFPNNIFHFSGYMTPPKRYLSLDTPPKIVWLLKDEYKDILSYKCQKAVGKFRGKTWIAYFTKDIPSHLGPWKIIGLPGLVLQAESDDGELNYMARRIIKNSDLNLPKEIYDFIDNMKNSIISYKDYINKENEFLRNQISQQLASMPAGSTVDSGPLRSSQPEVFLEWETEPAKP